MDVKALLRAQYGENYKITDGNYDKSPAVQCVNGTLFPITAYTKPTLTRKVPTVMRI